MAGVPLALPDGVVRTTYPHLQCVFSPIKPAQKLLRIRFIRMNVQIALL